MKKCIVGHAGARDYYQLARALEEDNLLALLVTDFFVPDFLNSLQRGRTKSSISTSRISISTSAMLQFLKEKLPFVTTNGFLKKDEAISLRCLKEALASGCNLMLYSYYAYDAFKHLKDNNYNNKRILFQLHPHPLTIRRILEKEVERLPFTKSSIYKESEFSINSFSLERLSQEVHFAEHCIVASTFTKNSLVENGANPDNVKVIPYGVESKYFPSKQVYSEDDRLRVIFVGSMVQRKGLADLLSAFRLLKTKKISLTLVGRTIIDKTLLEHFSDVDFTIKTNISQAALIEELQQADVFVLPALAEGFAHVILEAMAVGLPVITTSNTAGPDIINQGEEGFIVPIRSADAIAEKLEYLLTDKCLVKRMGMAAASKAQHFTWGNFRKAVVEHYKNICNA